MLVERLPWIGLGAIAAAFVAFVVRLVSVTRGKQPASNLIDEALQDVGLICLGGSLMFDRGTPGRVYLMASFVVIFGSYVVKRIWERRGEGGKP
ncbi:MAG: hypothetical protein JSW58_04960 [Candidatus Latescibacterota bacterium]|nr:MAG: hypothetical protein JSW58_04960 [Candidatus Latescibacterota bacterium]